MTLCCLSTLRGAEGRHAWLNVLRVLLIWLSLARALRPRRFCILTDCDRNCDKSKVFWRPLHYLTHRRELFRLSVFREWFIYFFVVVGGFYPFSCVCKCNAQTTQKKKEDIGVFYREERERIDVENFEKKWRTILMTNSMSHKVGHFRRPWESRREGCMSLSDVIWTVEPTNRRKTCREEGWRLGTGGKHALCLKATRTFESLSRELRWRADRSVVTFLFRSCLLQTSLPSPPAGPEAREGWRKGRWEARGLTQILGD